jgi:16S rRNA C967 or C1407 C5-methylase (RsmB/RsmF family)
VTDALARLAAAGVEARETAVPGALERVAGRLGPLAAEGVLYVQDAGSQMVAHLAASHGLVLDACAAPGGKALLMADLGGLATRVIAAEASRRRLATSRAARGGRNERLGPRRGRVAPALQAAFDSVLLDAPCSGSALARTPTSGGGSHPRTSTATPGGSVPCSRASRPWSARAVGSCTRPARSSPRRTKVSWPRFSSGIPTS